MTDNNFDSITSEKPPFNVGDLVMMRESQNKLHMFRHCVRGDIGLVLECTPQKIRKWNPKKVSYEDGISWQLLIDWNQNSRYAWNKNETTFRMNSFRVKKAYR